MSALDFQAAVIARLPEAPSSATPLTPVAPGVWRRKRTEATAAEATHPARFRPFARQRMALRCGRGSRMSRPFFAALAVASLALPARAACPLYTTTAGPTLQYDLSSVNGKWVAASLSNGAAAGVSYAINFVPNGDCTVRWVSLWGETLVGGATAGSASTFNWLAGLGLGTYNNLVSLGVGVPFVSASAADPLTGLFVGKLDSGDLHLLVGFHLTFELTPSGIDVGAQYLPATNPELVHVPLSDAPCSQRPGCVVL